MENDNCSKNLPKTFQPETLVNFDGYALHDAVREDYVQPFNSVGVHLQEPIFLHG